MDDEERILRITKDDLEDLMERIPAWDVMHPFQDFMKPWEKLELAPPKDYFQFCIWAEKLRHEKWLERKAHSRQESVTSKKEDNK